MTKNQRILLSRRIRESINQQPEVETLRSLLLEIGGIELVAPPNFDSNVSFLIDSGFVMSRSVACNIMEDSSCHHNVSRLWIEKRKGLIGIGTGYALSGDGLWRQHSWGVQRDSILETTKERLEYFGRLLQGVDADYFAELNV